MRDASPTYLPHLSFGRRLLAWCELLRVPNLLTVPGDPLVGYLLAGGAYFVGWREAVLPAVASLLLYATGLLLNDLIDFREDSLDRPQRPLPSGRVRKIWAAVAALLCATGGLAATIPLCSAARWTAAALLATVILYTLLKRVPVLNSLLMGACRGLSLLLGAAAAVGFELVCNPLVLLAVVMTTAYVTAVSAIARGETRARPLNWLRSAPAAILAFCMTLLVIQVWPSATEELWAAAFIAIAVVAVGWSGWCSAKLAGTPAPSQVQRSVGGFIRGLLLIQAALACIVPWPGMIVAGALLAAWPMNALLARQFKPS